MALASKPKTADGYSSDHTNACEQVLVTLLGAFGTLKSTIRLVGGLVPRYLTPESHPDIPPHAGTSDVDVVLNLQVIAEGKGYASLAQQLTERGFERFQEENGWVSAWRWQRRISQQHVVLVEFLKGAGDKEPFSKISIDGEAVSALAIEYAEITHDWYEEKRITAKLLNGAGIAIEDIRYADLVAFIILKALAFDSRGEPKDAGDLIHVMQYAGPPEHIASRFLTKIESGTHKEAMHAGLDALQRKFAEGNGVEGYLLTGPVLYGQFMHGKNEEASDEQIQAQRFATGLVTEVLRLIHA
ncbi:hypothetical protein [Pseudomonas frederiksbergensis]|uniref:hypothetical protein n=1 Tax=Pseudomonas frederiksbergensis TaxID=104087 RepID=UPI000F468E2F|nr:hypothetical protein [Pseudomonas frederiksbergensis]RON58870.1 hypothetical protein BK667_00680 [Pseudomonas frederiksbergensis]